MTKARKNSLLSKGALIGGVVITGAAALLASVQSWIDLEFQPGVATIERLSVTGQQISPALTLIALAALAAALVLTIAGRGFRRVIGVLIALLGVGLAYAGVTALLDPLVGASGPIEQVSGIAGTAQQDLVNSISVSFWPTVTVFVGVLLALSGVLVLLFAPRWQVAGRKYEAATGSPRPRAASSPSGDRISDWDALSDGSDPTGDDEIGDEEIDDDETGRNPTIQSDTGQFSRES